MHQGGKGKTHRLPQSKSSPTAPHAPHGCFSRPPPAARLALAPQDLTSRRSRSMRNADSPNVRGACAFANLCATSVHSLPGLVAQIEAPQSVTPVLVCLTLLAGAPGFDHHHLGVCSSGHSCPGVCSGRGLRALWPWSLGAPSVPLPSW